MEKIKVTIKLEQNKQPLPDLAECYDCKWKGEVTDCIKGVDTCPECGRDVEYDRSTENKEAWLKWNKIDSGMALLKEKHLKERIEGLQNDIDFILSIPFYNGESKLSEMINKKGNELANLIIENIRKI